MIKRNKKPIKKTAIRSRSRKSIAVLRRKLWSLLSTAIKERDGNICVSCGNKNLSGANFQAGHLFSAGGHSNLRYHPYNIHTQDARCNIFLRGNIAEYSAWFIKKYGVEAFTIMSEASRAEKKWTSSELSELIEKIKLGIDHYTGFYETVHGPDLNAAIEKYTMQLAH